MYNELANEPTIDGVPIIRVNTTTENTLQVKSTIALPRSLIARATLLLVFLLALLA
jgi:hypothetical protein